MKKILLTVLLVACSSVWATDKGHQRDPSVDPNSGSGQTALAGAQSNLNSTNQSSSFSTSSSVAGAISGSSSNSDSSSGASATSGSSTASGAGGNVKSENRMYVAPAPVQAANLPTSTANCTTSSSRAFSIGWSFVSWGQSDQDQAKTCLKQAQIESSNRNCQFHTAALLQKNLIEEIAPELKDQIKIPEGTKNYPPENCHGGVAYVEVEKTIEKIVEKTITEFLPAPIEKKTRSKKSCKAHSK